jgi:hypothetical protein
MIAPYPKGIALILSRSQRRMLMEHAVGPQQFVTGQPTTPTVRSMLATGLLKGKPRLHPKYTELTVLGREVVCIVLGEYADYLLRVGPDYEHRLLGRRPRTAKPSDVVEAAPSPISYPPMSAPISSNG